MSCLHCLQSWLGLGDTALGAAWLGHAHLGVCWAAGGCSGARAPPGRPAATGCHDAHRHCFLNQCALHLHLTEWLRYCFGCRLERQRARQP